MATKALQDIAKKMANLDICMMTTQNGRGSLTSRPMSNNGDVTYDGHSYFFTYEDSQKVKDIEANPQVVLNFEGPKRLQISVAGEAHLLRSRSAMEPHWMDSLSQWFEQGLDTPGIVMIRVSAKRIRWWQDAEEGDVTV